MRIGLALLICWMFQAHASLENEHSGDSGVYSYTSKSNRVLINWEGVAVNDVFFPFGEEQLFSVKPKACRDLLIDSYHISYEAESRFARLVGYKIVLIELRRLKRSYTGGRLPFWAGDLSKYSEPAQFSQAVITSLPKNMITFHQVQVSDSLESLNLQLKDLENPSLFEDPEMKKRLLSHDFRDKKTVHYDVLFSESIRHEYDIPKKNR